MKPRILVLSLTLLVGVVGVTHASTLTYDFTVTATSGPLSGDVSQGSFTVDSSIIPPGNGGPPLDGGVFGTDLLTSLSFTWNGIAYSTSSANSSFVEFGTGNTLVEAGFGTNCNQFGCGDAGGTNGWYVFYNTFYYALPAYPQFIFDGHVSYSVTPVPEPATNSLLGLCLAGVLFMRRRKPRAPR